MLHFTGRSEHLKEATGCIPSNTWSSSISCLGWMATWGKRQEGKEEAQIMKLSLEIEQPYFGYPSQSPLMSLRRRGAERCAAESGQQHEGNLSPIAASHSSPYCSRARYVLMLLDLDTHQIPLSAVESLGPKIYFLQMHQIVNQIAPNR